MVALPPPPPGRDGAEQFVARHLGHLVDDAVAGARFAGGQRAADAALAGFDVSGYARARNEVWPPPRRGASQLSPYIRHGLLPLKRVWLAVGGGPAADVKKFRDELLWQEYARHWYARLGRRTRGGVRREIVTVDSDPGWDRELACIELAVGELVEHGWLVNQTRMWLASHWSVRHRWGWRDGEDAFFRHLLDGSRAANRLGWQWTTGVGSNKPYGFSRYQVEKRAPGLCETCPLESRCPIEDWPPDPAYVEALPDPIDPPDLTGPVEPVRSATPDTVWVTAESLGTADPAMAANPDLPAVFVFDDPLLARLRLSAKRLIFLTETLAELASGRELHVMLGDPTTELRGRALTVTHAPVPGFATRAASLRPVEVHPWPWLAQPAGGSVQSFSAWRRSATVAV